MFSSIRRHFGSAGLVVAILALVAALAGAAFAASKLTNHEKREVKKIAKKYAGKNGATGPQGPAGSKGETGAAGKDGGSGANGANGVSPEGTSFVGSKTLGPVTCSEGGVEYKGATTNLVCNGKEGPEGPPGMIHPGETLASEASETGTWSVGHIGEAKGYPGEFEHAYVPISFTVPLAAPLEAPVAECKLKPVGAGCHVHYINAAGEEVNGEVEEFPSTACEGTVAKPTAKPGQFCVYAGTESLIIMVPPGEIGSGDFVNPATGSAGVSQTGDILTPFILGNGAEAYGTWAVTAP